MTTRVSVLPSEIGQAYRDGILSRHEALKRLKYNYNMSYNAACLILEPVPVIPPPPAAEAATSSTADLRRLQSIILDLESLASEAGWVVSIKIHKMDVSPKLPGEKRSSLTYARDPKVIQRERDKRARQNE